MQSSVSTDFSQIGYGHLNTYNLSSCYAAVGSLMKQIHETSIHASRTNPQSDTSKKMKQFSKDISAQYVQMTRGQLTIFDKIVRGTLLNGPSNTGVLHKNVGKNMTYIHRLRFGYLMAEMLRRIDYIIENFTPKHEAFPFKSDKLRGSFNTFIDEFIDFADFLEDKCDEWKKLFYKESMNDDVVSVTDNPAMETIIEADETIAAVDVIVA